MDMWGPCGEDPRGLSEHDGNLSQPPCPALTEGDGVRLGVSLKTDPERDHSTDDRTDPNPTATIRHHRNRDRDARARHRPAATAQRRRTPTTGAAPRRSLGQRHCRPMRPLPEVPLAQSAGTAAPNADGARGSVPAMPAQATATVRTRQSSAAREYAAVRQVAPSDARRCRPSLTPAGERRRSSIDGG